LPTCRFSAIASAQAIPYNQPNLAGCAGVGTTDPVAAISAGGRVRMPVTCPNCGNERNFQVKTLQVHVVRLEDARVEVQDENRPNILEFLCDECETALSFEHFEEPVRKEILLTLGAR
jgi:RNase P subunit RPR2